MTPAGVIILVLLVGCLLAHLRVVSEDERLIVIRLGHLFGVKGSGIYFLLTNIDRGRKIRLNEQLPEWKTLTPDEISDAVIRQVLGEDVPKNWINNGRKARKDSE